MEAQSSLEDGRLAVDDTALLSTYDVVRGQVQAVISAATSSRPGDGSALKMAFCSETWPGLQSSYERLVNEVVRYFRAELGKRKFDCLVLGRVKSAESVQKSLDRREKHRGKSYSGLEDIFMTVHDLAGSLIIVQYARDLETVNGLISHHFRAIKPPTHWSCERQPGELWDSRFGSYESYNHHVTLKMMSDLPVITFEVQVTTCSDFMYNRIAHDWFYKKARGPMSRKDEMVMDMLHGAAAVFGIGAEYMKEREQENHTELKDQFDLTEATKLAHGVEEWQLQFEDLRSLSVASLLDEASKISTALLTTIQTWKDCPSLLLALNNEVSDARLILHQFGITHESRKARLELLNKDFLPAIQQNFETTAVHLKQLNELLDQLQKSKGIRKKLKLLSEHSNVHKLQTALRKNRQEINDLLSVYDRTKRSKTEVELDSVEYILDELHHNDRSSSGVAGTGLHEFHGQSLAAREPVATYQAGNDGGEPGRDNLPYLGDNPLGARRHVEHGETQKSHSGARNVDAIRKGTYGAFGSSRVEVDTPLRSNKLPNSLCAKVNVPSALGNYTPLTEAILQTTVDTTILVDTLIDAGADVNSMDNFSMTPFITACWTADLSTVRRLRKAGGKLGPPKSGHCGLIPIVGAIHNNRPGILEYLIEEAADINESDPMTRKTPLQLAIAMNKHECFRLLLAHGADYFQVDDQGETILHYLARMGDAETVRISKDHGLAGMDPTLRNSSRQTALEVQQLHGFKDPITSQAFQELLWMIDNTSNGGVKRR
ncbi:hypothetical protein E8E14_007232 [Neopestalotiopsis sp. 37M]|nr:hypothetical protein E8E14_007232 [Neopestalotiopsis sp. 37M]